MDPARVPGRSPADPARFETVDPLCAHAADAHALLETHAVLDVRDETAFRAGHLMGSGHVPADAFVERRAELPPRPAALLVVAADARAAESAARELARTGFTRIAWLDGPIEALAAVSHANPSSPRPWVTGPAARLWRPSAFLADVLEEIPARGRAVDLASGSGRDAAFLALHGLDTEAWDHDTFVLGRAAALAKRSGAAIRTLVVDLEAKHPPLVRGAWDVIVCFRFLHRPLLPRIADALAPGGHLVYETYRAGQERFGKPQRARFLLESGELVRAFTALEILRYAEPSPPAGPWTARLHARKPLANPHPTTPSGA